MPFIIEFPTQSKRNTALLIYGAAVFFFWSSLYIYVPTLPLYIQTKTQTLTYIGVVLSMYGLWQALLRLPLGIAADALGRRKPFIMMCFGLSALGALVMGSAQDVNGLILGRGISGLAAAGWVPLAVVFSSLFPPQEAVRASAMLSLINSISRMLATSVTGALNDWSGGFSLAFYIAIGLASLAILMMLPTHEEKLTPKTSPPESGHKGHQLLIVILLPQVLIPSLLGAVNQYAVFSTSYGFFPILAKQFGATNILQSAFTSLNLLAIMLGSLLTPMLVKHYRSPRLVYVSFGILSAGIVVSALSKDLGMLMAANLLTGFATGIGYPILMGLSIERVVEQERNTAMGVFQSVYGLGMFGGPWLSGILADSIGIQPMLGLTSVFIIVLGIVGTMVLARIFSPESDLRTEA